LPEFAVAGVRPVGISVDSPEVSRELIRKAGFGFTILSDANREAMGRYDLQHARGGPERQDIERPAEFLVDSSGVVRWTNFTEDVRVRARANEMLAKAKELK
jgi:peroxiredoxin